MQRLVRLVAEDDKTRKEKIIFHLIVDGEKMIHQEMLGYLDSEGVKYPMVVKFPLKPGDTEQVVDFGGCCEDTASVNLFSRNIKLDEYFTFKENGVEYTYQIKHLTDMIK